MSNIFYSINELSNVAEIIILKSKSKLICFYGAMGVGKTTLIKKIIEVIGSQDTGNSPTFGIVNNYYNSNNELIAYHLDCYRLESAEEALDIGIEEYLQANCWIFIEWPEKIKELLPSERTEVHLRIVDTEIRELKIRNLRE